jgi:hypothetical protein
MKYKIIYHDLLADCLSLCEHEADFPEEALRDFYITHATSNFIIKSFAALRGTNECELDISKIYESMTQIYYYYGSIRNIK